MYTDEQLLKLKKQMQEGYREKEKTANLEEECSQSIYDETIKIFGKEVHFERREIPEFDISIYMPEDFKLLDEDLCKIMYPAANGPRHVFNSDDEYMSISFKLNNNIVENEHMKEFTEMSKKLLEVAGPKVKIVKSYMEEIDEMHVGIIQYISNAMDAVAYTVMGIVPLKKGVLLVCIGFKNRNKKRLCPIADEVLKSIETIKRGEEA